MARLHQYASSILQPGKADGKPVLAKKLLPCLEEMMEKVIFPPYIDRIGKGFFTKQAKPTAAQWRTFGELLGPLIFPWLWAEEATAGRHLPQEELATCLKLFAVVRSTFQSALSEAQSTNGDILSREMYGVLRWLKWSVAPDFGFDQEKSLDIQVF
ncbi:hypothetical protein C345_00124 [Cryptococcus neoformans A2-102-5]|nr:hypothetical protein C346_03598 [Cryptococcus neoformans var. grubii D17-1]OXG99276.1 hypothetical protein C345_00124 [Cryptococcus neoformans var. grubii A2-102-5]